MRLIAVAQGGFARVSPVPPSSRAARRAIRARTPPGPRERAAARLRRTRLEIDLRCLPPTYTLTDMKLPDDVRKLFARYGRQGGKARALRLNAAGRRAIAQRGASARWVRERFGASSFAALGLPGGEIVDTGLRDLADGTVSPESLAVSLAAPRLRREGVPVPEKAVHVDAENRLYELLSSATPHLAHARYAAHLEQMVSFADACRLARRQTPGAR